MDILADMFNLNEDVLRKCLQDTSRKRPHLNTLAHIASVIGCPVTDFIDSPDNPPPTIAHERWAGLNEEERALLTLLIAEFSTDELSIAEKKVLYKAYKDVRESVIGLRKAWKASPPK